MTAPRAQHAHQQELDPLGGPPVESFDVGHQTASLSPLRLALDIAMVVVAGLLYFTYKQVTAHCHRQIAL